MRLISLIFLIFLILGCATQEVEETVNYISSDYRQFSNKELNTSKFSNLTFEHEIVDTFELNSELFFVEKSGYIKNLDNEILFNIADKISDSILYSENGIQASEPLNTDLIVFYTNEHNNITVSIFTDWNEQKEIELISIKRTGENHSGGGLILEFPWLYLSFGDGKYCEFDMSEICRWAQDTTNLRGTVIRYNLETTEIELLAFGFRNPWKIEKLDNLIYVFDVGHESWEEINVIDITQSPKNYGWPIYEGFECVNLFGGLVGYLTVNCNASQFAFPLQVYPLYYLGDCAIIGGPYIEKYNGILFGDYCSGLVQVTQENELPLVLIQNKFTTLTHIYIYNEVIYVIAKNSNRFEIFELITN